MQKNAELVPFAYDLTQKIPCYTIYLIIFLRDALGRAIVLSLNTFYVSHLELRSI